MADVLLDFSNLVVGGALQVASATLADLTDPPRRGARTWLDDLDVETWLSPDVAEHLTIAVSDLPGRVVVKRTAPSLGALARRRRADHAVRFTLFGPTYTGWIAEREVMGFASVTLMYPEVRIGERQVPVSTRRERWVKGRLLRGADAYVVETPALVPRMKSLVGIDPAIVHVVENRPHRVFLDSPSLSMPADGLRGGPLRLLYPTRLYPHKNLNLLASVADELRSTSGVEARFIVTLRDSEWLRLPHDRRRCLENVGEVTPTELLRLYSTVDAVFFPSLLEASSATPLEANAMGVPLLASDRDFVVTAATANELFDPLDHRSAARAVARFTSDPREAWAASADVATRYRDRLSRSSRTDQYLDLIESQFADARLSRSH